MTRVILGHAVASLDGVTGRHYPGNHPGRVFDVHPDDARAVVKAGGALASVAGTTRRAIGYRCGDCGFGSCTVICGRCGGRCCRE